MTNNAASAVLVFALIQIVLTSTLPGVGPAAFYLGIAVLMGAAIPFARQLESRWRGFEAAEASDGLAEARFRHDRATLWAAAILFPVAWITLYLLIRQLAATLGL